MSFGKLKKLKKVSDRRITDLNNRKSNSVKRRSINLRKHNRFDYKESLEQIRESKLTSRTLNQLKQNDSLPMLISQLKIELNIEDPEDKKSNY